MRGNAREKHIYIYTIGATRQCVIFIRYWGDTCVIYITQVAAAFTSLRYCHCTNWYNLSMRHSCAHVRRKLRARTPAILHCTFRPLFARPDVACGIKTCAVYRAPTVFSDAHFVFCVLV